MHREAMQKSKWKILEVVELYYIKQRTPKEIAEIMNVSPTTISRILSYAKSENIVRTYIEHPFMRSLQLAQTLKEKYRLEKCIISSAAFFGSNPEEKAINNDVALESARYLQSILTMTDIVGFGWGNTTYQIVYRLNPCVHRATQFVLMNGGGLGQTLPNLRKNLPLERMHMSFKGSLHVMRDKVLYETEEALIQALQKSENKRCFALFPKITVSICGVGSFIEDYSAEFTNKDFFPKADDLQKLIEKGTCANFLFRFFDSNGKEVDTDLKRRTLAISIDQYKQIPHKIIAASGIHKADAVRAVLNSGYADVLIVDEFLGEKLAAPPDRA